MAIHHEVLPYHTQSEQVLQGQPSNHCKHSIPTGAGADETMMMKVPELKRGSLEATIYWCKQFQDLIRVSVKATFHSTLCTLPTHLVDKYFLQSLRFHLSM
jgi:hypothetical protein